jgi:hypothetical protein
MAGTPQKRAKRETRASTQAPIDTLELLQKLSDTDMEQIAQVWMLRKGIDPRSLAPSRKWAELPTLRLGWMPVFLHTLRDTGNVRSAATAAGISRATAYAAREEDEVFAGWWQQAIDDAIDLIEMSAWALASRLDGSMIRFLLTAHRPETYAKSIRMQHSGDEQNPVKVEHSHQVAVYLPDNGRGDRPADHARPAELLGDSQPVIEAEAFSLINPGSVPAEGWQALEEEDDEQ